MSLDYLADQFGILIQSFNVHQLEFIELQIVLEIGRWGNINT